MFLDSHRARVDEKNRFILPKKYRKGIEEIYFSEGDCRLYFSSPKNNPSRLWLLKVKSLGRVTLPHTADFSGKKILLLQEENYLEIVIEGI